MGSNPTLTARISVLKIRGFLHKESYAGTIRPRSFPHLGNSLLTRDSLADTLSFRFARTVAGLPQKITCIQNLLVHIQPRGITLSLRWECSAFYPSLHCRRSSNALYAKLKLHERAIGSIARRTIGSGVVPMALAFCEIGLLGKCQRDVRFPHVALHSLIVSDPKSLGLRSRRSGLQVEV